LKLESNNIPALINKGTALSSLGNYPQAIGYFDKVLKIQPNNVKALNGKNTALEKLEKK
jgi:tetratricopeptide (TPR) repeat protein